MKVTIGLLIFVCITAITIHLTVGKKIDGKIALLFLGFAVLSGFVAANYDLESTEFQATLISPV